jgi:uncharacterized protein DUF1257
MSKYIEAQTQFKDADLLIEALETVGLPNPGNRNRESLKGNIERHAVPHTLLGIGGTKRPECAEIIIRRGLTGYASNDIGFALNPETGMYNAIISEFDRDYVGCDAQWLNRVSVAYREAFTIREARKQGARFIGRKQVNGKIQLQFAYAGK